MKALVESELDLAKEELSERSRIQDELEREREHNASLNETQIKLAKTIRDWIAEEPTNGHINGNSPEENPERLSAIFEQLLSTHQREKANLADQLMVSRQTYEEAQSLWESERTHFEAALAERDQEIQNLEHSLNSRTVSEKPSIRVPDSSQLSPMNLSSVDVSSFCHAQDLAQSANELLSNHSILLKRNENLRRRTLAVSGDSPPGDSSCSSASYLDTLRRAVDLWEERARQSSAVPSTPQRQQKHLSDESHFQHHENHLQQHHHKEQQQQHHHQEAHLRERVATLSDENLVLRAQLRHAGLEPAAALHSNEWTHSSEVQLHRKLQQQEEIILELTRQVVEERTARSPALAELSEQRVSQLEAENQRLSTELTRLLGVRAQTTDPRRERVGGGGQEEVEGECEGEAGSDPSSSCAENEVCRRLSSLNVAQQSLPSLDQTPELARRFSALNMAHQALPSLDQVLVQETEEFLQAARDWQTESLKQMNQLRTEHESREEELLSEIHSMQRKLENLAQEKTHFQQRLAQLTTQLEHTEQQYHSLREISTTQQSSVTTEERVQLETWKRENDELRIMLQRIDDQDRLLRQQFAENLASFESELHQKDLEIDQLRQQLQDEIAFGEIAAQRVREISEQLMTY